MPKFHTVPNSVTVQTCLDQNHNAFHCTIVRRDKEILAMYPTKWTNNRIPSIKEVQADARWQTTDAIYPCLERSFQIERPHCRRGRPGYRWVPGWLVRYSKDRVSMTTDYNDALNILKEAQA